jgi:hypothetical protein
MGTHDTRSRAGFDGAVRRAGTFLSGLLPGLLPALLAVNTLLAIASPVGAEDTAAAETSSGSMQKMIDQQLDKIPSGDEGVNQIMGELTDKLTLTPDQQKDIRPSIVDTVAAMEKSRDRFRAGEITPMAMAMQVQMAGQKAAVLIEPVLDEEQMVKYKALRQDQRRQMMQAMQQQQRAAGAAGAGGSQ